MQNTADVSTPSPAVLEDEAKRQLVRCIQGGTDAMRSAGELYLPRHPAESVGVYKTRLQKTFLDNFVGLAIEKATGKLFSKPVKTENIPETIETILDDVDRQGRALHPFMLDVANVAFQDGISFVMADMPKVNGVQTREDEKQAGVRPYAIHIKPSAILETLSDQINGVETLVRVRISESVSVPDPNGWGYIAIEQIRVWYRDSSTGKTVVRWELYRKDDDKNWVVVDDGLTSFSGIYLVPFYTNRTGFMRAAPPFQNIAESNLEHWQVKSEFSHALSMQCFGMLTATGVSEESTIEVGPAKVLRSSSPEAKFGYAETTGTGVTLSADALKAIESRIETAGVNLRVENAGSVTATAAAIDSADTHAGLMAVAHGFSDSLAQLLGYFAEIMGIEAPEMEACVNDDFGAAKGSQVGLQELTKARALGDISRKAWAKEMQRRGELAEDFDVDENEADLDEEGPNLADIKLKTDKENQGV